MDFFHSSFLTSKLVNTFFAPKLNDFSMILQSIENANLASLYPREQSPSVFINVFTLFEIWW